MPASDPMQLLSDAIAAIIEADAGVQALTQRPTDNIVRWRRRKSSQLPRLSYVAGPTEVAGGLGENYDIPVTIRAEAKSGADANALLRAAVEALTVVAFETQNCDAVVLETDYDNPPDDDGDPSSNKTAVIAEADLLINLTLP